MRASIRLVAGAITSLLTVFMLALPAAAQYGPGEGSATGPDTVTQGTDATFQGEGFEPGSEVLGEVIVRSPEGESFSHSETLTADADGVVTFTFGIPCTVMQGDQGTVTFTGDDGTSASESFTVGGEAAGCPGGLATTGSNITNGLLIVAAVVILGAGLVVAARRRSEDHVQQS